jgi:hypothetical protein
VVLVIFGIIHAFVTPKTKVFAPPATAVTKVPAGV